jgi:predicted GNAT family N-acyltransferase
MTDAVIVRTPQQYEDALSVRLAVFVIEQQIPREEEIDQYEDAAIHCVLYDDGKPVGAGRLVPMEGYGKVGRMSVLAEYRGRGHGARVLAALERAALARGLREARLSAQLTARGFYERAGYEAYGDVYDDVGIPHIDLKKRL